MMRSPVRSPVFAAICTLLLSTVARADGFKDDALRLNLTYPHGWAVKQGADNPPGARAVVSFYAPRLPGRGGSENVSLAAQPVPPGGDTTVLAQLVSTEEGNMAQAVHAAFEPTHALTVGGLPAISHVYTAIVDGQQVKGEQWYVLSQDHLYLFTFTGTPQSFAKYQKQAAGIVASLTFAAPATAPAGR